MLTRRKGLRRSRLLIVALLICMVVGVLLALLRSGMIGGAFGIWGAGLNGSSGPSDSSLGSVEHSAKALDQLPVLQTRSGSVPPYSRDEFGQRWADIDHNGCDTRNDILRRDLHSLQMKTSSPNCVVVGGILDDPYTGRTIEFHKGEESSDQVQIDHVVALANAWRSGAWQWDATRRQEFANDPANLLAVDGNANQDKGASRADQWLPPNSRYRCAYVQRQIVVKSSWGLGVTPREKKAMKAVLDHCE